MRLRSLARSLPWHMANSLLGLPPYLAVKVAPFDGWIVLQWSLCLVLVVINSLATAATSQSLDSEWLVVISSCVLLIVVVSFRECLSACQSVCSLAFQGSLLQVEQESFFFFTGPAKEHFSGLLSELLFLAHFVSSLQPTNHPTIHHLDAHAQDKQSLQMSN